VPGNPLADINLMTKVSFVMKEGVVYKQPISRCRLSPQSRGHRAEGRRFRGYKTVFVASFQRLGKLLALLKHQYG
jgi:hypothetical protein